MILYFLPVGFLGTLTASKEVTIGNQVWMTENLNVDKFRNGDSIFHAKTSEEWEQAQEKKQPAWCYYNYYPDYGKIYGKLYNWYACVDPRGLAPKGWRIPSDGDWLTLFAWYGGLKGSGTKLKSTDGWGIRPNGLSNNGVNKDGFSALPGGRCNYLGGFFALGDDCFFWSSSKYTKYKAKIYFLTGDEDVIESTDEMGAGLAVRCLRD